MRGVKASLPLLLLCLLAAAPDGIAAPRHFGRRLATGPGDLLVLTDPEHDRVALFDVSGPLPLLRAEFGVSGSRAGQFRGPHGAAVAPNGSLVVADSLNHRLESFDLAALLAGHGPRLVRSWGRLGNGAGELDMPSSGIAWLPAQDGSARLFVADTRNHRVVCFDESAQSLDLVLGRSGPVEGQLDWPAGIAVDAAHAVVYVADQGTRRVLAFNASSGGFLFAAGAGLEVPVDVAVDERGDVWVVDQAARRVVRFTPVATPGGQVASLRLEASWGRAGAAAGAWDYPQSIAVDARGRVYVTDRIGARCQMFSRDGVFLASFGGEVGAGTPRSFGPLPGPFPTGPTHVCSNGGRYGVTLTATPQPIPTDDYAALEIEVRDGCADAGTGGSSGALSASAGLSLGVDAWMPEHAHGMNTRAHVEARPDGGFLASGLLFHMPGRWQLFIDLTRSGVLERAQIDFVLP
jgi:DNA-binding beta-propeller fold protein YncE